MVGPWLLDAFMSASGLDRLEYVMLLPTAARCVERVATRLNHEFSDEPATRTMHAEFANASIDARHVPLDPLGTPDDVATAIVDRFADGSYTYGSPAEGRLAYDPGPMKVTARADYAVRAVVELGAADGRLMKADLIAEAQGIPRHFLDNILNDLRRAGIVATQRGAEGGSRLARPADEITLADVMRAMEGPLAAVRDVRPEQLEYQGSAESLPEVWLAVRAALRSVLERVTVADVVNGKLPRPIAKLLDDPEAWKPH